MASDSFPPRADLATSSSGDGRVVRPPSRRRVDVEDRRSKRRRRRFGMAAAAAAATLGLGGTAYLGLRGPSDFDAPWHGGRAAGGPTADVGAGPDRAASKADAATPPGLNGAGIVALRDLAFFSRAEAGEATSVHYVAELHNVGHRTVAQPRAEIVLFDARRRPLGEASCDALVVGRFEPGDVIPCTGAVAGANGFASHRVTTSFSAPDGGRRAADLSLTDIGSAAPRQRFGSHRVTGSITNRSVFDATDVWLIVGLYGDDGKIVGAGRTTIETPGLAAGATTPFAVSIFNTSGRSTTSRVVAVGYERR
ncbi:MAG: FxLYD domain-containing protein [Myxococcota bacterium]